MTAAQKLGGDITSLVSGSGGKPVAEEAAKVEGVAKVLVVENEKSVWEKKESLEGGLDELDQGRFIKVKDDSERLGNQFDVPTLEEELKQLKGDLDLGKMEIPQALLERLQGLQNVPDTDIVNTNTMGTGE